MVMPRRSTAALAVLLVAVAGCGPAETSVVPSEVPVTDSALPGALPSDRPSPAAGELSAGPLAAGRYTRSSFEPRITLAVDDAWQAVQLFAGFFDIQQDVGSPDVIAVQFGRPTLIFGGMAGGDPVTTADAAVASLGGNATVTVVETDDSLIGGLEGSQITVENAGAAHAELMRVPVGTLGIDPGRRLWIAFFDTDHGLLAIMVGGSIERWDDALAAAEPVLESVTIGP
jgi:hypothetical protein